MQVTTAISIQVNCLVILGTSISGVLRTHIHHQHLGKLSNYPQGLMSYAMYVYVQLSYVIYTHVWQGYLSPHTHVLNYP